MFVVPSSPTQSVYVTAWGLFTLVCGSLSPLCLVAEEVDYASEVQPILARNCYACHGPDMQEGSLRFDARETLIGEADSGLSAIVPGEPEESELLRRVRAEEYSGERMPPEGEALSAAEIGVLERWIASGAEYTAHWAFLPPRRPPLPAVRQTAWASQPLDYFIKARLEAAELAPVEPAPPAVLIRRAYLDITGLPPSPERVAELTENWTEDSYVQLIDQLLAAPGFGERWARTWLDVVRYAETNSFERDGPKPNAWKYRDYVIEAFNHDTPYDQFIREQIAGDELDEVTGRSLTATGYYRLGIWDDEPADPLQAEFDGYDDLVTTTSQAFLGLTLNCARCHDHKIDPLTQKDYYSMVAFLRDVTPYGTRADQVTNNQLDLDPELATRYELLEEERKALEKKLNRIEQRAIEQMPAPDQRATEGPEREHILRDKLRAFVGDEVWEEYSRLKSQVRTLKSELQSLPPRERVLGLAKLDPRPPETHLLARGSPHAPAEPVEPSFPNLLGGGVPDIPVAAEGAHSAGRRRVLAEWLASDDNWLTARVIVNRIWLYYFGRGIVRSPNNFGLMGEPPTHPALLDFLAMELVRHNWSLKAIHRTILLSSTYRLGSQADPAALAQDPRNDLFWRQNVRRLSAEQIRDAVLAVSGQLDSRRYGESMYPMLSDEVLASQSQPGKGWGDSSAADRARRSVYIHVKRSLPIPLLTAFDFPETDTSCEARFLTTQPGQALTMLNSQWMQQQSEALLERVKAEVGEDLQMQARRCLELVLSDTARQQDVAELTAMVRRLRAEHGLSDQQARQAMCLVVLNINPFIYVD